VAWRSEVWERHAAQRARREHQRELTAARQAAERERERWWHRGDPAARHAAEDCYRREVARIEAAHQAWLREHTPGDDPPDTQHVPRSRRVVPSD
jgi:hypothetical protein